MEIITLLKANIRKKKGTFFSILLLMCMIAMSAMGVFGMMENCTNAMENAFEISKAGDITVFIEKENLTKELRRAVEENELVGSVRYTDTICAIQSSVGDKTNRNSLYMMELRGGILLYNEDLNGFSAEIPALKRGEIYLPLGMKSTMGCQLGDTICMDCEDGIHEFLIKGFVQEPAQGSANIGWKQVFITHEDFERIWSSCKAAEGSFASEFIMLLIDKAENCSLSDAKFRRQLNLDTKIIAAAEGSLTKAQSLRYTGLFFEILSYVFLTFVSVLFVVVLIVMSHSISTEIEIDYVNLGILKSQGFTRGKIRKIILIQYLAAETAGIITGSFAAIPLERMLSDVMIQNTAILPDRGFPIGKSLVFALVILLVSAAVILIKTEKVSRISPVRAISGGKEEIYFDSRFHGKIRKKALSLSLAFRQFTSGRKRYAGTIMIVAILTFFMMTVNLIGNLLTSRKTLETMGIDISDIKVRYQETEAENYVEEIEALVESYTAIEKKYYINSGYMSINGEELRYDCYRYPEYINAVLRGRAPLYDNEIVITEMIADTLEVEMGDEVTLTGKDKEETYLISGIYQSGTDSGMNFAMSFEGAKKMGVKNTPFLGFALADTEKKEEIAEELNRKYGDVITAEAPSMEEYLNLDMTELAVNMIKTVIYTCSVLFALIVIRMVCQKSFVQERRDIGIYKAIGFTSGRLRIQFAFRFLVVAVIGAALGTVLSIAFSAKLLGSFLGLIGLSQVNVDFTPATVAVPIAVMSACFFFFAYLVSGRIKSVAIRELVVE